MPTCEATTSKPVRIDKPMLRGREEKQSKHIDHIKKMWEKSEVWEKRRTVMSRNRRKEECRKG